PGAGGYHMAFPFPVMPRLYMAIRMEDRYPVVDILEQTPPIPASCQWATFLDRKSTRLNSSHPSISYAVFCLKKNTRDLNCFPPRHPSYQIGRTRARHRGR